MFWIFIFGTAFLVVFFASFYIYFSLRKTNFIKNLASNNNYLINNLSFAIFLFFIIFIIIIFNSFNLIVIMLHLIIFLLICDLIFYIIKKKKHKIFKKNYSLSIAISLTILYLTYGFIVNYHVFKKTYNLTTDKYVSDFKIVLFADSHIGSTFNGKELYNYVIEMNKEKPDAVIIAGDFVDERTTKKDMIDACKSLSYFDTKYGVYFVYGNHDDSNYIGSLRNWKDEDLRNELIKANVNILEDDCVLINDEYYILGRIDASDKRKDIKDLSRSLDESKYIICVDHQPVDYEKEENANLDLVLSGHTHGGQFLPLNLPFLRYGNNDLTYGYERRNNKDFIVTSGISDWAFKFKTGTHSEYVVINIDGNK